MEDKQTVNSLGDYLNRYSAAKICYDPLIKELFEEYLLYGGLPIAFDFEEKDKLIYLEDIFYSILFRDLLLRYNLRDANMLKRLIIFLMDNTGKVFSAKSISDHFKNEENIKVSPQTVRNYINCFENSSILRKANMMVAHDKALKFKEKYYITDWGFNQVFNGRNLSNMSQTIENIVYIELLRKGYDVNICQVEGKEAGFVCQKFNERVYVKVIPYLSSEEIIEKEFDLLLDIRDNYPKYVISTDTLDFSMDGIIHLNLIDFLVNGFNIK